MLQRIMHAWERRLSTRDKNRTSLPFEWGLEFLNHGFVAGDDIRASILQMNRTAVENSHDFFRPSALRDVFEDGETVRFASSIQSPYPENNVVGCRLFAAKKSDGRAVVVLPQWNADHQSHVSLCRVISRLGITALRLTLPYHEERNPSGPRSDYMVSPNIGRTIQAIQQSVTDARNAADWLLLNGYRHIGIMGTSVGSCISFLAFVHDQRFRVGVFNHVSSYFGDVVWNGISTQHVRKSIENELTAEELREAWSVISPNSYVTRLRNDARKSLLISAKYDLTFPPHLSALLLQEHQRCSAPYDVAYLPCGHYTSAIAPFKHLDGFFIGRYLHKHLRRAAQ